MCLFYTDKMARKYPECRQYGCKMNKKSILQQESKSFADGIYLFLPFQRKTNITP